QLEEEAKRLTGELETARAAAAAAPKTDAKSDKRAQQLETKVQELQSQLQAASAKADGQGGADAAKLEASMRARQTAEGELKVAREQIAQLTREIEKAER